MAPSPWSAIVGLLCLVWSGALPAAAHQVPPELQGHLDVAVERCEPGPPGSGLLLATVRIETGAAEIRLPELHCGAFVPASDEVLFLNAVDGGQRVPAHATRRIEAHFPGDARHTECRCVIADVRRINHGDEGWREVEDWAGDWWRRLQEAEPRERPLVFAGRGTPPDPSAEVPQGEWDDVASRGPLDLPFSNAPRLRREWVLRSDVFLRHEPAGSASEHSLQRGQPVDVLALDGGAKQVRLGTGRTGWIDGDASSPERRAAPDLTLALDALATEGHGSDPSFCRDRSDELRALVFALLPEDRTAYVSSEWYLLSEPQQDAFQVWTRECYGIGRIVEVERGQELRSHSWGDRPTLRLAADPARGSPAPPSGD